MNKYLRICLLTSISCLLSSSARAQYTGNNQTNTISGVVSNWVGDAGYVVGSNYVSDALYVVNAGALSSQNGFIGYEPGATGNVAIVSDVGSVWSNQSYLWVGLAGGGNQLIITNKGSVYSDVGFLGGDFRSTGNVVTVSGSGSVWTNQYSLQVGYSGPKNVLIVTNQGKVVVSGSSLGIGEFSTSDDNEVIVTGVGSTVEVATYLEVGSSSGSGNKLFIRDGGYVSCYYGRVGTNVGGDGNEATVDGTLSRWSNNELTIGGGGTGSRLIVTNGGSVTCAYGYVGSSTVGGGNTVIISGIDARLRAGVEFHVGHLGNGNTVTVEPGGSLLTTNLLMGTFPALSSGNLLKVAGGTVAVTNASSTARIDVRNGTLQLDSGTLRTDKLLLTNQPNGQLVLNGGDLYSKSTFVTNGSAFVVGNSAGATANLNLLGGIHAFKSGLHINSDGVLTGCGTVSGTVVNNGIIDGTCISGSLAPITTTASIELVFTAPVTNSGTILVGSGQVVTFQGPVVNSGIINTIYGTANFAGSISNIGGGVVLDAAGDPDGDGFTNLQEDTAGTNPLNESSALRVTTITLEGNDLRVTWTAVGGTSYRLQTNAAPTSAGFTDLSPTISVPGSSETTTNYLHTGGASAGKLFYRARVVP